MTVPATSSYLRYLPPVLWEQGTLPSAFSLGAMLLIFEKILTGIEDDSTGILHEDHQHPPIEETIAILYQLFDPWRTPAAFLPWLASWLGLTLIPTWDEYQCRKAIAEITQIYRQRGLKAALQQYLSLYTVVETRPRIAIDDGGKLLFARPTAERFATIHSLVSQSYFVPDTLSSFVGLIRPWYLAVAPDGSLFIGDRGTAGIYSSSSFAVGSQVWHLSATGAYTLSGTPPVPQPVNAKSLNLDTVGPLAVRTLPSGDWELYVLDSLSSNLYRLSSNLDTATLVTKIPQENRTFTYIAMAVDTNNDLLILERGDGRSSIEPTPLSPNVKPVLPRLTTVYNLTSSDFKDVKIKRTSFPQVLEPLSLLVLPNRNLIIGDGGKQTTATGANLPAADLVYVDRSDDASWKESPLLTTSPNNPLVAPTAIVREDDGHILVLDAGLKPFEQPSFFADVAEPAAIYRVDLTQKPPVVTLASETGNMVYPTGMVLNQGMLFMCDPGQTFVSGTDKNNPPLPYRLHPHEFGVVIHFCKQRFPSDPAAQQKLKYQIIADVKNIIDQEKPAHTLYQLVTEA